MARRTGFEPVIMVRQTIVMTPSLTPDVELVARFERAWTVTSPGYKSGAIDHYATPAYGGDPRIAARRKLKYECILYLSKALGHF